jgi:uncharacterized OB-fold protein
VNIDAIVTHIPAWEGPRSTRVSGRDEDAVTLGVEVARALLDRFKPTVQRVVFVTNRPDIAGGDSGPVIMTALRLESDVAFEQRLGGAPAALEALADAGPGTIIVAADPGAPASAAAALIGPAPTAIDLRRHYGSLPAIVQRMGDSSPRDFGDPRLLRERGTAKAVERLVGALPFVVAGARSADSQLVTPTLGAASTLFALATVATQQSPFTIVAVENGQGVAVDLPAGLSAEVVVHGRAKTSGPVPQVAASAGEIPISLAAYGRAFPSKVGFGGQRCTCGVVAYPPRSVCFACAARLPDALEPLPLDGELYSVTTVHVPVPSMPTPYSLGVVALDGSDVRVLAHVTDVPGGVTRIGDRGRLVLRKVAERAGLPDYGYAFAPEEMI